MNRLHLLPRLAVAALLPLTHTFRADAGTEVANGTEFFRADTVRPLTLKFTAAQWAAIEPTRAAGANTGPGGRGSGGFDPSFEIAAAWLKAADSDGDGKISTSEFSGFADARFSVWDTKGDEKLTPAMLAAGMGALFSRDGQSGGPRGMQGANGKNGMAAAMGVEFKYVKADLDVAGTVVPGVGVRYTGNNTYMSSGDTVKKPFKVKVDKYDNDLKFAGVSKFNLRNNINDASAMNEALSYALYADAGVASPRTTYAKVYLDVPGKYDRKFAGLYTVVENIDKTFVKSRFGVKKGAPGALFKPSTRELFADLGDDWAKYERSYAPAFAITEADKARVIAFSKLVSGADDTMFAAQLGEYADIDEMARYLAVTVWLSSMDSILEMGQNYYLYLEPKTNRFLLLPWDLDHSFGQWMRADTASLSVAKPWSGENKFLERLFKTPAFREKYDGYIASFGKTLFKPEAIAARMKTLAAAIRPAVAEESAEKLARFDIAIGDKEVASTPRVVAVNEAGSRDSRPGSGGEGGNGRGGRGGPGGGVGPGGSTKPILVFMRERVASVEARLAGKAPDAAGDSGRGGPGGRNGGPGGGFGGPGEMISRAFFERLDADKDGALTRKEFDSGFSALFAQWDAEKAGYLTSVTLAKGLRTMLPDSPFGRPGPGGGFRPGDDAPPAPPAGNPLDEDDDNE